MPYTSQEIGPNMGSCLYKLRVDGRGSVMAEPDTAVAVLGVTTENMQLEVAQRENAEKTSAVIQAIMQLGIPKEAIQTQAYLIQPQYDFVDGRRVFRGYLVVHNLRVTVKNVGQVGRVIDTAVRAGANTVNDVSFTVTEPAKYYAAALNAAIEDAVLKAAVIGSKLNVTVYRPPVQITEKTYQVSPPVQPLLMQAASPVTPIQPGQIEITALIEAIFAYR